MEKKMLVNNKPTLRGIVNFVNSEEINKEDIVAILLDKGQYNLIYYK